MKQAQHIWNERYSAKEFAYGKEPNIFFAQTIAGKFPGKLLVPAAGEGRDAVHAALLGWNVTAFDMSAEGKRKCDLLAVEAGVQVKFTICDALDFEPDEDGYDLIVLSYFHLPSELRQRIYRQFVEWLKPGGAIVLEAFSKRQLGKASGGPKELDWLFSLEELKKDFSPLDMEVAEEQEIHLSEGVYHQGPAAVIRIIAKKNS